MSGQSGSIGAIVLGVVVGIVAIATQQYWLIPTAVMLAAGGAVGLAFQPKTPSQEQAKARQLELATASTGFPIPVIFGEQKVIGNFMNFTKEEFRTVAIYGTAPPSGGKGEGDPPPGVIGFDYYLSYEYGLCMGPVDSIHQIYGTPGDVEMHGIDPSGAFFDSDDYMELNLDADHEGGTVRVYKGSAGQTRIASGDPYYSTGMNYRNICWALYGVGANGYHIGRNPAPKTYAWIIRRLPVCVRDDGTTVNIIRNAAETVADAGYYQANPAAMIWEIITNKLWGRGLSSDFLDEASFINASQYFFDRNIGMSFTLDQADKLTDIIDSIRQHLNTIVVWDGEVLKLRVLINQEDTHDKIQTLTANEVSNLSVTVPDWYGTVNEVRAEFNNKARNYRPDIVQVQDLANIQNVGGRINPQRISLNGFTDFNIARKQAFRILTEVSYPRKAATWEMNRFKSQIEIGDIVRMVWKDWSDNETTVYWMLLKIEEGESDSENIRVTAIEDTLLTAADGVESSVTIPPEQPWEHLPPLDPDDVNLFEPPITENGPIEPIMAIEVPAIKTAGAVSRVIVIGQRQTSLVNMQVFWGQTLVDAFEPTNYAQLDTLPSFAITGTLTTALDGERELDRSSTGFQFNLTNEAQDESALLGSANKVSALTDDVETLIKAKTDYLIIGEEIMQVGKVEKISPNLYRARNIVRGRFGTSIVKHDIGAKFYYTLTFPVTYDSSVLSGAGLLDNALYTKFKAYPVGTSGVTIDGDSFYIYHDGARNKKFYNQSQSGLVPGFYSLDLTQTFVAQIRVRVRHPNYGAGTGGFINSMKQLGGTITGITFQKQMFDAAGVAVTDIEEIPSIGYTNESYTDRTGGTALLYLIYATSVKTIRIYSAFNGKRSLDYLQVNL